MRTTRTAVAATAAVAALLTAAGTAAADTATPSGTPSAQPSAAAKAPTGDGARALCKRVPKIDTRISTALKRLSGPVTERGSVARLQQRVTNAKTAGHSEIETFLNDRLTFRKSLVTTLTQRSTDLAGVRTWCATHDNGKKGGGVKGAAK